MRTHPADLVLTNGHVITVDAGFSIAQAVAIADGRFVAVGTNAQIAACTDARTQVIDLAGRALVPGLIDGHAHLDREGLKSVFPALGMVRSIRDIQTRIEELVRNAKPGEWIITMPIGDPPAYFDVPGILKEGRFPNRYELDEVAPDNPVYIRAIWGFWRHTTPLVSIANSRALRAAGVDRHTPPPAPAVRIEHDGGGEPTGVFFEDTMMPIVELTLFNQAGRFSRRDRARVLPQGFEAYHAYGTTSIFEEHGAATELIRAYTDVHARGALSMRTALVFSPNWRALGTPTPPLGPLLEAWGGWLGEPAAGDDWLKISGCFVDLEPNADNAARARALPYTGWAGFNYDTALPQDRALELLTACAEHEIRPVAIWPNMIDLYYAVHQRIPLKGKRWVLGHISTLNEKQLDRIAEMGLVLTSHTNRYIFKEGHLLKQKLGVAREHEISPLRSIVERGIKLALATDNVPVSMFYPLWQAVTRRSRYVAEPVVPSQAITREDALRAATINGAYLTFDENKKGSIEPGKLADCAVLDRDPLTVEEDQLKDTRADLTVIGGRIVYQRRNQ